MTRRKQLSMVLPVELIAAIKLRAASQGLSITAYITSLVQRDLGEAPNQPLEQLSQALRALEVRVQQLEQDEPDNDLQTL